MATQMFKLYDNLPEGYIPNNRPKVYEVDTTDTIVIGGTAEHSFVLHFAFSEFCNDFEIMYKQSVTGPILTFTSNSVEVEGPIEEETPWKTVFSTIKVHLLESDTRQFDPHRETYAQIKLTMKDGSIVYGDKNIVKLVAPLDAVPTESPVKVVGFGWTED